MPKKEKKSNIVIKAVLVIVLIAVSVIGYFGYMNYLSYIDPNRIYGTWSEIDAPPWKPTIFTIDEAGVTMNNRYIASSFEFDGKILKFEIRKQLTEYEISGDFDERLKRISSGGYKAQFIKQGYEHTLPKEDPTKTKRQSITEHFK